MKAPPPHPLNAVSLAIAMKSIDKINNIRFASPNILDSIGLELKIAMLLVDKTSSFRVSADNNFWERKCKGILLRPAIEPIYIAYRDKLVTEQLDFSTMSNIATILTARHLPRRGDISVGRSVNGDVIFENLADSESWLIKIRNVLSNPDYKYLDIPFVFAQTIISHPFYDGNGRIARLLVHAVMAKHLGLCTVSTALAPPFYLMAEKIGRALTVLCTTESWNSFSDVFYEALVYAHYLSREAMKYSKSKNSL